VSYWGIAQPLQPQAQPALIYKDGHLAGKRIEVRCQLVVGRENVDVLVEDSEVSRRHAAIRPVDGRLEISDLGSTNGTFVNGARIRRATPLGDGDVVRIGRTSLVVELPPPGAAGPDDGRTAGATVVSRRDDGTQ
jgi:pSer/pThr/pTyr-binding forkhead associated (FHA) protein